MAKEQLVAAGISIGVILIWILMICILFIVAKWKIFVKAGEKGWKSLIPIYSLYISFKISKINSWYFLALIIAIILPSTTKYGTDLYNFTHWLSNIVTVAIYAFYSYNLSKSFGKGLGFSVGLFFFPVVFQFILGYGSAEYEE